MLHARLSARRPVKASNILAVTSTFHLIPDRVSFRGATHPEQKDRGLRETPFDFVGFADRTYIVAQQFVDCVESVEPGVHRWIPMKVYNKGVPAYVEHPALSDEHHAHAHVL